MENKTPASAKSSFFVVLFFYTKVLNFNQIPCFFSLKNKIKVKHMKYKCNSLT